uniref:Reverse transcriptase zinc-binding domain-containing protein n=1 Tax=Fagus sylvatica TaxID=28930 RepID=A0A2N9IHQ9_FAGSY
MVGGPAERRERIGWVLLWVAMGFVVGLVVGGYGFCCGSCVGGCGFCCGFDPCRGNGCGCGVRESAKMGCSAQFYPLLQNFQDMAWIIDLFISWTGGFGKSRSALVWGAAPHCVKWLLWRERNNRVFEGQEATSMDLKSKLLRTLDEWVSITTNPELLSFEEFLNSCNLS